MEEMARVFERELDAPSPVLKTLVRHASRYRGKRLRSAQVLLVGKSLGPLDPEHVPVAAIVEMIHTATLVHDDVLDHAVLRRRLPSINARYGNSNAVLLGDYIYARAFSLSTRLRSQLASRLLSDVTRRICEGEIEQAAARFEFDLPQGRYLELIEAKTASLYEAACRLGAAYAGGDAAPVDSAASYGRNVGIAFQIIDDCLDFDGTEAVVGKSLGTDLEAGRMTLPLLRLLESLSTRDRMRVKEIALGDGVEKRAARLAAEFDLRPAIEESLQVADGFVREALAALDAFPPSPCRDSLSTMAEFVLLRRW